MSTITVTQQKLVLNAFAAIFQNNLASADLVTWKKFDGEMNDRNGLAVIEQVTPDYTTSFTANGVADLTVWWRSGYRVRFRAVQAVSDHQ
jgi:hypothetical protein